MTEMADRATLTVPHFDRTAETYDARIPNAIPGYTTLHDLAETLLATETRPDARVLIVGAGTGYEARRYAQHHPGWMLTAVEPSTEMTARAHAYLDHDADRIAWHTGTLDTLPATAPFDAATLLLVLHFLPDDGTKRDLLRDIAQRLKPGALLLIADLFAAHEADWARWAAYQRLKHVPEEAIERGLSLSQEILHRITEDRLAVLLHEAGFSYPERWYHALHVGGWLCRRSSD
ncbi:MAG: class I SAM-dependent methyltransferase [Rhodothermales bacterium]